MTYSTSYSPRWLYKFFDMIDRLPISGWWFSVIVVVFGVLISHISAWQQGLVPNGLINISLVTPSLFLVLIPALWQYLNRIARDAIIAFSEDQSFENERVDSLLSEFLSLPSILALILLFIGIFAGYMNYRTVGEAIPLTKLVVPWWMILSFSVTNVLIIMIIYRAIRQGIIARRLFTTVEINLFNLTSIFLLSRLAAQSSFAIILIIYGLMFSSGPQAFQALNDPLFMFMQFGLIGSLIFLFFAQLASVNTRMRHEKNRKMAEIGEELDAVYSKIMTAVHNNDYSGLNEMRNAASALKEGWETVKRIPTWPWDPETLRTILLPLLFPIIVYLLQQYAANFLGL